MSNSSSDFSEGEEVVLFSCRKCRQRFTQAEKEIHRATHKNQKRTRQSTRIKQAEVKQKVEVEARRSARLTAKNMVSSENKKEIECLTVEPEDNNENENRSNSDTDEELVMYQCKLCSKCVTEAEKDSHRKMHNLEKRKRKLSSPARGKRSTKKKLKRYYKTMYIERCAA